MKLLVVGNGGREHALIWKLKQSPKASTIFTAPGNAGTARIATNSNARSNDEIITWLKSNPVDLVIIGPDQYLADGLTNLVQELGIPVFGPTKDAAEIEWSKAYAKQLMLNEGIPTAAHRTYTSDDLAKSYVRSQELPIVIKADGLSAGKGVVIAQTLEEADAAIDGMLTARTFGDAGASIIIEEYLEGLEISVHAFCDGESAVLFPISKDHKRIFDGDTGPNTGGMGTVARVELVPQHQIELIRDRIVLPTLAALKKRGRPFKGILYPGVMLTKYGPMVIEFNARFGDPETQTYMRLLESDLLDILYACATGALASCDIRWSDQFACCIMLASAGYPATYTKGVPITLPTALPRGIELFHSGTAEQDGMLVTNGGRVLGVTAIAETLEKALMDAYAAVETIGFAGKQFRKDIGASIVPR